MLYWYPFPLPHACPIFFWSKSQTSYCFKVRSFQLVHNCFSVYMTSVYRLNPSPPRVTLVCLTVWVAGRAGMGTMSHFRLWADIIMPPPRSIAGDTSVALPLKRGIDGLSHLSHIMWGPCKWNSHWTQWAILLQLATFSSLSLIIQSHACLLGDVSTSMVPNLGALNKQGFSQIRVGLETASSISKRIHSPSRWHRGSVKFPGFCLYYHQFGELS